jgi:CheY-like chemotaxis protein
MTAPAKKILVVEDDGIIAFRFQELLQKHGYTTSAVFSGEEAVQAVAQFNPDLILMDVRLPGAMDGTQAAASIRERWEVPVVFLTAFSDDLLMTRAKASTPYGYLIKPVQDRELLAMVDTALHRHTQDKKIKENESRLQALFDNSPYPIWEGDLSAFKQWIAEQKQQGIPLPDYWQKHPAEVQQGCERIKSLAVNREMMSFSHLNSCNAADNIARFFMPESWPVLLEKLAGLAAGVTQFDCELPVRTPGGGARF